MSATNADSAAPPPAKVVEELSGNEATTPGGGNNGNKKPPIAKQVSYSHAKVMFEKSAKGELSPLSALCVLCCLLPILIALVLGFLTIVIAGLVFAFQTLIVGVPIYKSSIGCESLMGTWMVVYGSLFWASFGLNCFCGAGTQRKNADEEEKFGEFQPTNCGVVLANLIGLANMCWIFYGMNIVETNAQNVSVCAALHPSVSSDLYSIFKLQVQFMFWGFIAVLATAFFVICVGIPILMLNSDAMEQHVEKIMKQKEEDLKHTVSADLAGAAPKPPVEGEVVHVEVRETVAVMQT